MIFLLDSKKNSFIVRLLRTYYESRISIHSNSKRNVQKKKKTLSFSFCLCSVWKSINLHTSGVDRCCWIEMMEKNDEPKKKKKSSFLKATFFHFSQLLFEFLINQSIDQSIDLIWFDSISFSAFFASFIFVLIVIHYHYGIKNLNVSIQL